MRKEKAFDVNLMGNQIGSDIVLVTDDRFYTSDTEAFIVVHPLDLDFEFQAATIALSNEDGSLFDGQMRVVGSNAEYELPGNVIAHPGNWRGQAIFVSGAENFSSPIFSFHVELALRDVRPPQEEVISNMSYFISNAQETLNNFMAKARVDEEALTQKILDKVPQPDTTHLLTEADAKLTYATKNELAQVSSKVDFTDYYTKTQIDTKLSGVVGQPGPKGDTGAPGPKGDPGIGIPQKLSKTGNALTLSNGGGQVTLDYAPSNHTHPEYATEYFVHKTLAPIGTNAQQYVDNKFASIDKVANYAPATQTQVNAGTGNAYVMASHMSVFPRTYTTRVGNGSSTVFTVAHNLGTRAVQVTTYINGEQYLSGVKIVDANNVKLTFGTAWGTNQIEVVVIG